MWHLKQKTLHQFLFYLMRWLLDATHTTWGKIGRAQLKRVKWTWKICLPDAWKSHFNASKIQNFMGGQSKKQKKWSKYKQIQYGRIYYAFSAVHIALQIMSGIWIRMGGFLCCVYSLLCCGFQQFWPLLVAEIAVVWFAAWYAVEVL